MLIYWSTKSGLSWHYIKLLNACISHNGGTALSLFIFNGCWSHIYPLARRTVWGFYLSEYISYLFQIQWGTGGPWCPKRRPDMTGANLYFQIYSLIPRVPAFPCLDTGSECAADEYRQMESAFISLARPYMSVKKNYTRMEA